MAARYQRCMKKLGFLGAMNRDVVVGQGAASLIAALGLDATPLLETPVTDAIAQRGTELLETLGAATYLGGSAFNVARILAFLDHSQKLDLAFFGLAGSVGIASPHLEALTGWGIDTSAVTISRLAPATCLAMVEPAGRTLLTAPGANADIAAWLRANRSLLVTTLAQRDIVHVTSYLDPDAAGLISDILSSCRTLNPALLVSLDPGMAWLAPGGRGLADLLAQTHILHLNAEEFALLGGADNLAAIASQLDANSLIVARSHTGATLHGGGTHAGLGGALQPASADIQVIDATGAGDTFCGGFLWALCSGHRPVDAAALGFALARAKIAMDGPLDKATALAIRRTSGVLV